MENSRKTNILQTKVTVVHTVKVQFPQQASSPWTWFNTQQQVGYPGASDNQSWDQNRSNYCVLKNCDHHDNHINDVIQLDKFS